MVRSFEFRTIFLVNLLCRYTKKFQLGSSTGDPSGIPPLT